MAYLRKPIIKNNFNFIKIKHKHFTINRLELESKSIDRNNLDQYTFLYNNNSNIMNRIILELESELENQLSINTKIISPIINAKLKASSYQVKKINQTMIINNLNYQEKPKIGNVCDCKFMITNLYSFSDNPNIYRFKIKISSIEIIY